MSSLRKGPNVDFTPYYGDRSTMAGDIPSELSLVLTALCLTAIINCTEWERLGPVTAWDGAVDANPETGVEDANEDDGRVDTDIEMPENCGQPEEECCPVEPYCELGLTCSYGDRETPHCFYSCTLANCEYGDEPGHCLGLGDIAVCAIYGATSTPCVDASTGCTTEYGVSVNTFCITRTTGETFCYELCQPIASGCPENYGCYLSSVGGAICVRAPGT